MNEKLDDKQTVLVVDDMPVNIELLAGILTPDYRVLAAINGEIALRLVQKARPDIILLDILMPVKNGYETLMALKSDPATRGIPVVMLSSRVDERQRQKGLDLGAVEYLPKPVDPMKLRQCILDLLDIANTTGENQ